VSARAVRIASDHCLAPERVEPPIYRGRYRALFRDLPALEADQTALHALGRPSGARDLGVDADCVDAQVAAVWRLFGQLVADDITADRSPVTPPPRCGRIRKCRIEPRDESGYRNEACCLDWAWR
jgi:hypothetical protein